MSMSEAEKAVTLPWSVTAPNTLMSLLTAPVTIQDQYWAEEEVDTRIYLLYLSGVAEMRIPISRELHDFT